MPSQFLPSSFTDTGVPPVNSVTSSASGELVNNTAATKLMLHFNGSDGSSTFTDSAGGKTVTATGGIQIRSTASFLGSGGGRFDGIDDFLSLADHADWDLTGSFFISARIKPTTGSLAAGFPILYQHVAPANEWGFFGRTSVPGAIGFAFTVSGSTTSVVGTVAAVSASVWNDVAVSRDSATGLTKLWVNGHLQAASILTTAPRYDAVLTVGADGAGSFFGGDMDELILRNDDPTTFVPRTAEWTP